MFLKFIVPCSGEQILGIPVLLKLFRKYLGLA